MKIAIVNLGDHPDDVLHLRLAQNNETIKDYSGAGTGIPRGNYVELDIEEGVYEIYVQGDRITSTIGKVPIGKPQILVTDPPTGSSLS